MMESWQRDLDKWLTTPPEEPESKFYCDHCGEPMFPEEKYYKIEDENLCPDCARTWLDDQWHFVTEEMAYGEEQ